MCKKRGFMVMLLVGVLASVAFGEYSVSESQSSKTTSKESKKVSLNVDGCRVEARFEKSNTDPGTLTLNVTDKGKEKARTFVLKGAEVNGAALLQRQDLSGSEKEAVQEVLKSLKLSGETGEAEETGGESKVYGEALPQTGSRVMLAPPDRICPACGRPYDQGGVTGGAGRGGSATSYVKVGDATSSSSAVVHRVQSSGSTQVQIGAMGVSGFLVPPALMGSPQAAGVAAGPQTAADFRPALQVPDSQWATFEPALQKVLDGRSEQKSLMEKHLNGLAQQSEDGARKALKAYKEKARENRKQLTDAREALRKTLTPRQEAQLILLGVLD